MDDAVDFVHLARDAETGKPSTILVLDTFGEVAQDLSPDRARATARRLDDLANEWERHRPLRRLRALDDDLRRMDDHGAPTHAVAANP